MPIWSWSKKEEYFKKVEELLGSYSKIFIVGVSIKRKTHATYTVLEIGLDLLNSSFSRSSKVQMMCMVLAAVTCWLFSFQKKKQVDNVGSNQMQQIRQALRGQAVVLMGKNTRIRKVCTL